MGNKLTIQDFIRKSNITHNKKYSYVKTNYINSKTNVTIICPEHGEYEQRASKHIFGQGCPKCTHNPIKDNNNHIQDFLNIHKGKYDYSLVNYKNAHTKVTIICPKHGKFKQTPNSHKNGNGCITCAHNNQKSETFINDSIKVHGKKYDYSLVDYKNNHTKVTIICPKHGNFNQYPRTHSSGGSGCPTCVETRGERKIRMFLEDNDIEYITQYKFADCKHIYVLRFDFYLPKYNLCVEFNGKQHYKPIKYFGGYDYFKMVKLRDIIKKDYCASKNIPLLTIKYNDNVDDSLRDYLKM